jgi:hypothetical protein
MDHFALEREKRRATELAELEKLLRFPFDCGPLVHAHRDCVTKHGDWRPCDSLRVRAATSATSLHPILSQLPRLSRSARPVSAGLGRHVRGSR